MLNPTILNLANTLNAFHPTSPVSYLQVAHFCRNVSLDILKRMTRDVEISQGQAGPNPAIIQKDAHTIEHQGGCLLTEVKGVPKAAGQHFVAYQTDEQCKARLMAMAQGCERNNCVLLCDIAANARYLALPAKVDASTLSEADLQTYDRGIDDILVRVEREFISFSKLYDVGGSPTGWLTEKVSLNQIYENDQLLVIQTHH